MGLDESQDGQPGCCRYQPPPSLRPPPGFPRLHVPLFTLFSVSDLTRGLFASAPRQPAVTACAPLSSPETLDSRLGLLAAHPGLRRIPCLPQRPRRRVGPTRAFPVPPLGPVPSITASQGLPCCPFRWQLPFGLDSALWKKQKSAFQNCSGAAREGVVSHATEGHLATGLASLCL